MDSKEKEELLEIWSKFLNTIPLEEKEVWLDAFLAKFLHFSFKDAEKYQLTLIWKNASNSLAHQLLLDVHCICNKLTPPSTEAAEEEEESRASCTSSVLQEYLLHGRGWKLLCTLDILGIENLSRAKDLVNLLITLVPVALTFPLHPSTVPENILKKLSFLDCEMMSPKNLIAELNKWDACNKSTVFTKKRKVRHIKQTSKIAQRRRSERQKEAKAARGDSSSENDAVIHLQPVSDVHQKSLSKIKSCDAASLQTAYPSETDEPDSCNVSADSLTLDEIVSDFSQYSLCVVDYVSVVLRFLKNVTALNQQNLTSGSSCCPVITDFALHSLKNIQNGNYEFDGWPDLQVKYLRNDFLKLLFLSVKAPESLIGDMDEVLQTVLSMTSAIVPAGALSDCQSSEDLSFICDAAFGILLLINSVVCSSKGNYTRVISVIRTFSGFDGIRLFSDILLCLEQTSDCAIQVSNIFLLIKNIMISLKTMRVQYSYHEIPRNLLQLSGNLHDSSHHHNDILGSVHSHTMNQAVPICCVATVSHLMLKIYSTVKSKSTEKLLLKSLHEAGLCCCVDSDFVLNALFQKFDRHDADLQQLVLSVLEKIIYPQLGMILNTRSCCFCQTHKAESNNSVSSVAEIPVENVQSYFANIAESTLSSGHISLKWKSLNVYIDLLNTNDSPNSVLVTKHVAYLLLHSIDTVRSEIFVRAYLPQLLKLVFQLRNEECLLSAEQIRLECFISLLPDLLCSTAEFKVFVQFGGIRVLCEVLFSPSLRLYALHALKVLITKEIESHVNENSFHLFEPVVDSSSAVVIFSDILCQYSKLFLQKLSVYNQGSMPEAQTLQYSSVFKKKYEEERFIFLNGQKFNAMDSNFKISPNSELIVGLTFICDLWTVCKDIVLRVPASSSYLCSHVMIGSYNLFLTLLRNLKLFSEVEDEESFGKVVALVRHLLTVFLHFKVALPNLTEKLPSKQDILKSVRILVQDCELNSPPEMQLLLQSFLQCCLFISDPREGATVTFKKNGLPHMRVPTNWDNSSTSSGRSDPEGDCVTSSYDADSEKSNEEDPRPTSCNVDLQYQRIEHGEVIKMVLDLLMYFLKKMERKLWLSMAVPLLQMIVKFCQDYVPNKEVLCKQDICSDLLEGFFEVLTCTNADLESVQKTIMELFNLVAQSSMSSKTLKIFIKLFKSPLSPFDILVNALKTLVEFAPATPCHAIGFPCIKAHFRLGRSESKQKFKKCLNMFINYYDRKETAVPLGPCNAWNSAAAVFPLPHDAKVSLRRSFSSSLWVMFEKFDKHIHSSVGDSPLNDADSSNDQAVYHILSIGSDCVLLEIWVNVLQGNIVFRTNMYGKDNVVCLSEATCKSSLKLGVWHHVALNYKEINEVNSAGKKVTNSEVQLYVDGILERIQMKYEHSLPKNDSECFVLFGHAIPQSQYKHNAFYVSNFMLFKGEVFSSDIAFYIYSLGPDENNIARCALQQRKMFFPPKFDIKAFDENFDQSLLSGLVVPSLEPLQKRLLMSYSAEKPLVYALYPQSTGVIFPLLSPFGASGNLSMISRNDWPSQQEPMYHKVYMVGFLKPIHHKTVYSAIHHIGGIAVFLFLFARVIECCCKEETQAVALESLLRLITTDCQSADYFLKIKGDHLLHQMLTGSKCIFSHHILKVFFDCCLSEPVMKFTPWTNNWSINYKSEAVICRPFLWDMLLRSIFHSKNCHESVQMTFVNVLRLLVRPGHTFQSFNIKQMKLICMLETLLSILKDYYILADKCLPLEVAMAFPEVIKQLLNHPVDIQQFWLICNFLLLLHQASNTYVCHAKSSFYFLSAQQHSDFYAHNKTKKGSSSDTASVTTASSNDSTKSFSLSSQAKEGVSVQGHLCRAKSMTDISSLQLEERLIKTTSLPNISLNDRAGRQFALPVRRTATVRDAGRTKKQEIQSKYLSKIKTSNFVGDDDFGKGRQKEEAEEVQFKRDPYLSDELYFGHKRKDRGLSSAVEDSTLQTSSLDCIEVFVGLLNLIIDVISHATDEAKQLVLDVVQPEVFIVLAYNMNPKIRSSVIEVIHVYLQQAPEEKIADFLDVEGFSLLANQLHQLPADTSVIGACFSIMFFGKHVAEDLSSMSPQVTSSLQIMSWIPLLSLLPSTFQDIPTCSSILSALNHLLAETSDVVSGLSKNGLCESLAFLLTQSIHSTECEHNSEIRVETNTVQSSIFYIFRIIASHLFSSKSTEDFMLFSSVVQLFFRLETQCCEKCGSSASCVASLRDAQCVIFQAALDFIEAYNYRKSRDDSRSEIGNSSVWEILIGMPDSLNPYSSFLISPTSSISSEPRYYGSSPILSSMNTLHNAEKANKELPMSVAVDRFHFVLSAATDFVVFQAPEMKVSIVQKAFFQSLFRSVIQGLSIMMERNRSRNRAGWSTVILFAKDTLRLQLSRLLVASLAQRNDVERKFFVLETLADQRKCSEMLTAVLYTLARVITLPVFLFSFYDSQDLFSQKQKEDFRRVFLFVKQNLQSVSFATLREKTFIKQFTEDWHQLWLQDKKLWLLKQQSAGQKLFRRQEKLAKVISESAMDVTKRVVDLQSIERKKFMEEVKVRNCEEVSARETWHGLIEQLTHERAIWHMKEFYPRSWELDPTEGPHRVRKRLRRCYLNVEPRFVMEEFHENLVPSSQEFPFTSLLECESAVPDSSLAINKIHINEKIEYTCLCKVVMPLEEVKGELLIGDTFLHFIGEEQHKKQKIVSERWPFNRIKEILPRRFELRNNALEIFMENGLTFLVAFYTSKELEEVWKRLQTHKLPCVSECDVYSLTQLWLDRTITNFEYLTQLNKLAGRSFNDLMQYPVFPYVLADYSNFSIDLNDNANFRNLTKPVAVQFKERAEYYMKSYNALKEEQFCGPWSCPEHPVSGPFHYGSHYSNSGTVLHFLVRLLPYTYGLIDYQGHDFDIPDRTFHSIDTSWQLVTKNSPSDVKELIPEFFFLPEFLCNREGFDLGVRQTGERVHNVHLPAWCSNSPRLFVLIHRQALESSHVTKDLNGWIDLVFGYKQTGSAAIEAVNVFHPATYFGMDISKINDPVTRDALQATIKTVGQMPRQLFHDGHPMLPLNLVVAEQADEHFNRIKVLENVEGLKWGDYVGSPTTASPILVWRYRQPTSVGKLLAVFTNDVFGLQQNVCLLLNRNKEKSPSVSSAMYIRTSALVSWLHDDGIVRIKFCRGQPPVPLLKGSNGDPVCLCASDPDCSELFIAHTSGIIFVYNFNIDSAKFTVAENRPPVQLSGHSSSVNSICICKSFSIVVTASSDCSCIVWDLNKLCYVRSLGSHSASVKLVCVSNTLGDIASVSDCEAVSCLKVHTINGELVGSIKTSQVITALCYSSAPEGISVNVIATGLINGAIRLWSSWDLKLLREIREEKFMRPVTCMTFSVDNQHLYAANADGIVAVWEKPSNMLVSMPRFVMFT